MAYDRVRSRTDLYAATIQVTQPKTGIRTAGSGIKNLGSDQNMIDVVTGKWKPGRFNIKPVSMRKFSASCSTGTLVLNRPNDYYAPFNVTYNGLIAAMPPAPSYDIVNGTVLPSDVYLDSAIASAYAKMSQPDMDMGPFLAEINQTLKLFYDPMKALVGLAQRLKQPRTLRKLNNFSVAKQIQNGIDYASNAWLQLRYGICPLVSDINGIIKLFDEKSFKEHTALCRESGGVTVSHSSGTVRQTYDDGTFTTEWQSVYNTAVKVSSVVYFERHITGRDVGLTPGDLPSLIWELIPYSFVVDWAFGVGNWLRAVHPKPDRTYLGNIVSVKESTSWTRQNTRSYASGYSPLVFPVTPTSSTYGCQVDKLRRSINRPIPDLPVLNVNCLNIQRDLDSLSLIWQKMPKLKR